MPDPQRAFDPLPLHTWLVEAGLASLPADALFDGFCRRLAGSGVPLPAASSRSARCTRSGAPVP
jgi:hypothetical protein